MVPLLPLEKAFFRICFLTGQPLLNYATIAWFSLYNKSDRGIVNTVPLSFFYEIFTLSLFLVIEHTVAISLEIGVGDLLAEFLADALIVLGTLKTAGTIAAFGFKALFDGLYYFFVFVESDLWLHCFYSFVFTGY